MSEMNKKNFLKFIKTGTYTDKYGKRTNVDKAVKGVKKIDLDLSTMKSASSKKMNTGGLTGNQAKLDKNKNNRIDAEDFKLLRAGKKRGGVMKAAMGAAMIGKKMVEDKMPGAFQVAKMKKKALGFRVGGSIRGKTLTDRMKNVDRGLIDKKTGKPTSMQSMRELKGFKPGESAAEFNKRAKAMEGIKKVARATTVGKIALGVAGLGMAAKAFLDKKKKEAKEKKQNKKMGGGMMKRFNKGGGADTGTVGEMKSKFGVLKNKARRIRKRLFVEHPQKIKDQLTKKMGGGMMQLPTGYDKGGGADSGASSKGRRKKGAGPLGGTARTPQKGPRPGGRPTGRPRPSAGPTGAPPKEDKGFELKYPGPARPGNPVVVYSVNKGSMVKARGGGLAKTKPTKMY